MRGRDDGTDSLLSHRCDSSRARFEGFRAVVDLRNQMVVKIEHSREVVAPASSVKRMILSPIVYACPLKNLYA